MTSPLTRWPTRRLDLPACCSLSFLALTPLSWCRIRTYEHEALWGKALTSYDLHASLPEVTRQVGIIEVKERAPARGRLSPEVLPLSPLSISPQGLQNFGLNSILATYMRGLESEGLEYGSELRELRFQAAWRNSQWDCELSER